MIASAEELSLSLQQTDLKDSHQTHRTHVKSQRQDHDHDMQ